jgi:multidrug resistance efflux pump
MEDNFTKVVQRIPVKIALEGGAHAHRRFLTRTRPECCLSIPN